MSTLTDHQAKPFALELLRRHPAGDTARIGSALMDAQVDLNPHQVDAALFAFRSPFSKGVILADEVGLGKTIEAGLGLDIRPGAQPQPPSGRSAHAPLGVSVGPGISLYPHQWKKPAQYPGRFTVYSCGRRTRCRPNGRSRAEGFERAIRELDEHFVLHRRLDTSLQLHETE
jgi:hypothetical protein